MKLWDKGYELNAVIERFTVADDYLLDRELVAFDCYASMAHAAMLAKMGILTNEEWKQLHEALAGFIDTPEGLTITPSDEDGHTALENALCAQLGVAGKKIHTARSRNDQVLGALRLYSRQTLLGLMYNVLDCIEAVLTFAEQHKHVPMVGRTHFQKAMPSSLGLWAGALAESLIDDIELLKTAYVINNQCPLGSAASYGSSLPLDRQLVSDLLGFEEIQNNVLYANNSRGKIESIILQAVSQIMLDLSKYATDIILFSTPEFGYFSLPEELCSGSSLMPQKRNPCMLELVRAKSATVMGHAHTVMNIIRALPSGYNRDFQETKRPFMQGMQITADSLAVMTQVFKTMMVNEPTCSNAFTQEVFATDAALELISKGIPFRDAYKEVATHLCRVKVRPLNQVIAQRTHRGGLANLGLELAFEKSNQLKQWLDTSAEKHNNALATLKQKGS